MRGLHSAGLLLLLLPAAVAAQDGAARAAATITPGDIAARIGILAHDSMQGRDTPSPQLDLTAAYLAREFARFGLEPGGEGGGFLQRYRIERVRQDTVHSALVVDGGPTIRFGRDAIAAAGGEALRTITGPTVLLTGGMAGPDARSRPVAGKVVVAVLPTDGTGRPTRGTQAVLRAAQAGRPAALLVLVESPEEVWGELVRMELRERLVVGEGPEAGVPVVLVRERALGPVLRAAGVDLAAARAYTGLPTLRPLPRLGLTIRLRPEILETHSAPNVVGILRGSDPARQAEYVVFLAHMDHVGTAATGRCRPQGADSICNGADDNASGTAAVVELAEAFAQLQPRPQRSLLFVTVSGEEHGLWGSTYFTAFPPVPIDRMVAAVNLDMVGRNWPDSVAVIGMEHSELGPTVRRVAAAHPTLRMTPIPDPWPAERFYYRSDHYLFARRGVPVLFFFTGTHPDYHRPGDEPAKIDAEKQARLTQLVFYLGLEVANQPHRPAWDRESYRRIVTDQR